ncbi:MAG TPA: hypothetical protein VGC23_01715, partial [Vicinamibacterales bacterium]
GRRRSMSDEKIAQGKIALQPAQGTIPLDSSPLFLAVRAHQLDPCASRPGLDAGKLPDAVTGGAANGRVRTLVHRGNMPHAPMSVCSILNIDHSKFSVIRLPVGDVIFSAAFDDRHTEEKSAASTHRPAAAIAVDCN